LPICFSIFWFLQMLCSNLCASFVNLFPSSSPFLLGFLQKILANLFPSSHVLLGFLEIYCKSVSISTWVCLNLWWKLTKLLPGFSEKKFENLFKSFVSSHFFPAWIFEEPI
jgi:hypothetical protein